MVKLNPVHGKNWPLRFVAGNPACRRGPGCIEPANQQVQVFPEKNERRGGGFTERSIL